MTRKIILQLLALLISGSAFSAAAASSTVMWYEAPAREWMEGVPLGNGRLGSIVYGGIDLDRIALNEVTLWAGQRDTAQNSICGPEMLAEIRSHFLKGDFAKANDLANQHLNGRNSSFGTHLPMGDLTLKFHNEGNRRISAYRRDLDLATGVASTVFTDGGVTYTRRYICSYPDSVMALQLTASKPGALNVTVGTNLKREAKFQTTNEAILYTGKVDYPMFGPGGVNFAGDIRVVANGGTVTHTDKEITVKGANSITIYSDIRTDLFNPNYLADAKTTVDRAAAKGFDAIMAQHVADHSALFNRMSIDLGDNNVRDIPTDTRLHLIKNGADDPGFDALFFQYGRYMQIASSRPGSPLASNLQGIWNDDLACHMAWTCDYHLDININQNYWSPNRANLAECNTPMFNYVALLAKYGAETAGKVYGARGWCAHTITNPHGFTAPGGYVGWALCPSAGAWLATELWSHYLYTLDEEYLRRTAYPLLKSCAEFYVDYMFEDPKTGYLLTGPSISPENGYIGPDGKGYPTALMPTLDRAIVEQIYTACIESAKILNVDKKFRKQLEADLKKLPPYNVGPDGQVDEWYGGWRRSDPSHRHSSHLVALYPFGHFTSTKTPALWEASRKALDIQTADPNWEDTEWSTGNMICFQAFLKDGDKAHGWLKNLFKRFTRENLMTVSPKGIAGAPEDIFSFDATEASVAGICDMLLQSHDGFIEFLPALPSAWAKGSVKGLCARGALEADLTWDNGRMLTADIRSGKGGEFKVMIPAGTQPAFTVDGKPLAYKTSNDGLASVNLKKGQSLHITF